MEKIIVFCISCKYYEPITDNNGHCHYNPPDNGYTRVINTWWCSKGVDRKNPQRVKKEK